MSVPTTLTSVLRATCVSTRGDPTTACSEHSPPHPLGLRSWWRPPLPLTWWASWWRSHCASSTSPSLGYSVPGGCECADSSVSRTPRPSHQTAHSEQKLGPSEASTLWSLSSVKCPTQTQYPQPQALPLENVYMRSVNRDVYCTNFKP